MKKAYILDQKELTQAVADYVCTKNGVPSLRCQVGLSAERRVVYVDGDAEIKEAFSAEVVVEL